VDDGNYENRGELLLIHKHDGIDLKIDYARDTLSHLQSLWRRPVNLISKVEGRSVLFRYDGHDHSDRKIEL
jgi:stage V sporulation protein R